jgi:hypothetical protein
MPTEPDPRVRHRVGLNRRVHAISTIRTVTFGISVILVSRLLAATANRLVDGMTGS